MPGQRTVVRSYQRLFVPDRRLYAIDGKTLPIPGGVPLRWLAHAATVLVAGVVLAGEHPIVTGAVAVVVYRWASRLGRRRAAVRLAALAMVTLTVAGLVVGAVDWPLRLVVLPAVAATALTQLAPDGRRVHRYALSLLWVHVAGRRRLGQVLPGADSCRALVPRLAVAEDEHRPALGRGRITGPCRVVLAAPVLVRRRRHRVVVRPVSGERRRRGVMLDTLELAQGERAEVRP